MHKSYINGNIYAIKLSFTNLDTSYKTDLDFGIFL